MRHWMVVRLGLARRRLRKKWMSGTQNCKQGGRAWGRKRLSGRRNALLTADGAFAYSQSHWRRLVQRQDCAVRTQDIRADEEGKREALHHKQRMVHHDFGDFNRRINISANHSACASNANDFRSITRE